VVKAHVEHILSYRLEVQCENFAEQLETAEAEGNRFRVQALREQLDERITELAPIDTNELTTVSSTGLRTLRGQWARQGHSVAASTVRSESTIIDGPEVSGAGSSVMTSSEVSSSVAATSRASSGVDSAMGSYGWADFDRRR
jgi:RNA-splicing ligase RtcB